MKRVAKMLTWLVAVIVVAPCLCFFGLGFFYQLPTNKELKSEFYSHKAAFDELKSMLNVDRDVRRIVQGEFSVYDPKILASDIITRPVAETRLTKYRADVYLKLTKETGTKSLWSNEDGTITFGTGGWGFASYGPRWGYIWSATVPVAEEILDSLDDLRKKGPYKGEVRRYILLEDHWYIFIYL